jgi:hypothetical protein
MHALQILNETFDKPAPGYIPGNKHAGLNNKNIVGMEVIAKNNRDVTAAQIRAGAEFRPQDVSQHAVLSSQRSLCRPQ